MLPCSISDTLIKGGFLTKYQCEELNTKLILYNENSYLKIHSVLSSILNNSFTIRLVVDHFTRDKSSEQHLIYLFGNIFSFLNKQYSVYFPSSREILFVFNK